MLLGRYLFLARKHVETLRGIFLGSAIIVLACILREVEFDSDGPLGWADRALRGPGRIIACVIAIPVSVISLRAIFRRPRAVPRLLLGTGWGLTGIVGGLIVIVGGLYDRGVFIDIPSHRWEEGFETLGYLLIAASAFMPDQTAKAVIARPLWSGSAVGSPVGPSFDPATRRPEDEPSAFKNAGI